MDLGKYKKARRAMLRRQGGLRTVVFNPDINDTDVDFPDIERPQEGFAGGGAVKIIKRILSADDLRRLGKKEGIPDEDIEKFLTGEYGLLKRGQARGVVKRDKDGNIVVQDKYSEKYDPIRRQMLKDDPGMFDDLFDRMFGEYELEKFKRSGRKPNAEGGIQREGFKDGERAMTVTEKFIEANRLKAKKASEAASAVAEARKVDKPTPIFRGDPGKLVDNKYKNETQKKLFEGLIEEKFKYPKNSIEARKLDKKIMKDFNLTPSAFERVQRVVKNKYNLQHPEKQYTGPTAADRKKDKQRRTAKKRFSDPTMEAKFAGPKETGVQLSHMDNLYTEFVTGKNLGYAPTEINQSLLEEYDREFKKLYNERAKIKRNKPKDMEAKLREINLQGMRLQGETQGFKTFKIEDPKTGKLIPNPIETKFDIDPLDLLKGKTLKESVKILPGKKEKVLNLSDFDRELFEINRQNVIESVQKQSPELIKKFKKNLSNINRQDAVNAIGSLGCPANYADGGRVNFKQGSNCYAKGLQVLESAKAGDTTALGKVKRFFRTPAGKILGGIPLELAFEAAFVLPDYAEGKPWDEILGATTFGYFGLGTSPEESLYKYSGNDPKVKEYQETEKLYEQLRKDLETWKAYEQNPQRYRNMPQHLLKKSMGELLGRINDNVKLYQQKKHILDPKSEYAQAIEQAKQIQQTDYKKNIEESKGRQVVGAGIEKVVGGAKTAYDYITKAYDYLKEKINPDMEGLDVTDEIVDEAALFASGGRVGFKEGGGGFTRRGFLKLLGGIAAIIGAAKAGLKFETKAAKQVLKNAPTGTPEWFAPLVEKIAKEGVDVPPELMMRTTTGRETVKKLEIKDPVSNTTDKYYLFENPDTGEILVDVDVPGIGANDEPFSLYMRPKKVEGVTEEGIQQIDEGEFLVNEQRATGVQSGPDDWDMELLETHTDLEGSASDWHALEKLATGKTDEVARAKKQKFKNEVEADPTQDIINRQGEYDYPGPDVDDYE